VDLSPARTVAERHDAIIAAGQRFPTGTRVITWLEPDGYNAYGTPKALTEENAETGNVAASDSVQSTRAKHYGARRARAGMKPGMTPETGSPTWAMLRDSVDQFVIHYDACGTSRECFRILHEVRGLSCHFLLDLDGTIYQTLDLQESAWHATTSNNRSIGIEIANIGAYPPGRDAVLREWYRTDAAGRASITIPERYDDGGLSGTNVALRPARPESVKGVVQSRELVQYDFTPQQYEALIKLTAALCRIFPRIECDYPRDARGQLANAKLPDDVLAAYRGLLGHFHVQKNKVDPGPAFQWDRVVNGARSLLRQRDPASPPPIARSQAR
jgi:N-acetyl-anhydromuramyl-L-alanine amidase AmpD